MKAGKVFRYEMEPALLAKKWELNDLVAELKKTDHELDRMKQESTDMQEGMKKTGQDWMKRHIASTDISVSGMQVVQKYLRDLSEQRAKKNEEIAKLEKERETWKEKIALSKKSVEILENHKVKMKKTFLRSFDDALLKQLDDQWNVLRPYREEK